MKNQRQICLIAGGDAHPAKLGNASIPNLRALIEDGRESFQNQPIFFCNLESPLTNVTKPFYNKRRTKCF